MEAYFRLNLSDELQSQFDINALKMKASLPQLAPLSFSLLLTHVTGRQGDEDISPNSSLTLSY